MPRYAFVEESRENETAFILTDAERHAEAVVFPRFGNNCTEFRTTPDGTENIPTDVFVPPDDLHSLLHAPFAGGNPILFPFPNRVREGRFTFEGRDYFLEGLLAKGWDKGAGQAIHGLVGDKPWAVEEAASDEAGARLCCSLQLDAFPDIAAQYPFPCRITVTYRLAEGVLQMQTEVTNTGERTLPMGFGIHPWFPVRLRPGDRLPLALADVTPEERGEARVHIPATAIWELDKLMPNGRVVPVEEAEEGRLDLRDFRPLRAEFYDNVFTGVIRKADDWSEGGLRDPATGLEMWMAADPGFREWVLYAPLNRPVIALEPYTCTTDAVNLQARGLDAGLIALPAGETWKGDIHFGLRHAS